ncbi:MULTISPECIES: bifunctional methylenetetrahydrofolate dehydrogenase/methenyltetrahydrofolate cyclohydrolase FolD [Acidiplasma]|uniref:Bifunctional protein FolD n=1 Tax=Acidiplasma aeolicum TaxID=507754 RepID=A0A0P9DCD0_9ARCH|nr:MULTISPECIES: bifunctional methylenetetrahydrofolate dehydrogenase/methenyltetrahydrofolate cyclohydrolase FolD [Acidiplasma]KJE49731.1 methenyltetrahydrofolate cyclohydrolase [Acidiplasma sp. MBA-1]KPV47554.1 methenyltetrahydrofolate cyclohydrolase [Acidiplasma aeolicum]WMT55679.1 MAG: bifunctional methylenetetrahydrofolate dehydrogenase/methenyltetrahydrofolate cyclohydrolase FolD [Acidiplasma sp.]
MILDGNLVANKKMEEIKNEVDDLKNKYGIMPHLKLIQIGNDAASSIYANAKIRRGKKLGINVTLDKYQNINQDELIDLIKKYSIDKNIHGIMMESPLPENLNYYDIIKYIPYYKDSDGLSPVNLGNLYIRNEEIAPATARAVVDILEHYGIKNGNVCIVNRSPVVGRPLSMMLLNRDFTVSICHSKTSNLKEIVESSDILVAAIGKKHYFGKDFVNNNSIVIDVGINYEGNKIYGDVNFDEVSGIVKAITPVPGGVGAVTATDIFQNFINGIKIQMHNFV